MPVSANKLEDEAMSQDKDPIPGVIMANCLAWNSLLEVLADKGLVEGRHLYGKLLHQQQHYHDAGNDSVAVALGWFIAAAEKIKNEQQ